MTNSKSRLRFLLSLITRENDYQREQAASALQSADRLGVDLEVIYADNDGVIQSQQLLKVIQSGTTSHPDGIMIEPAGATALPQVARAAAGAGIAWVVINREADYITEIRRSYSVPVFSVGADQQEVGNIQARQFRALLPKGGAVLYIQGPSTSTVSRDRAAGMLAAKPENIHVKVLKAGNWTEEGGHHAVTSWLRLSTSRKEHIDLVGCQNDLIATGARRAFQELAQGVAPNLPFTGVDGLPKTGQQWVRSGALKATVVVPATTAPALNLLVTAIRTGSPPPDSKLVQPESFPVIERLSTSSA